MARQEVIEVQAGSSEAIRVELSDANGTPIPSFAGWRALAQVRRERSATSPVLYTWDSADGSIELVGGDDSHALLRMPAPEVSLAWTWRLAWLDMPLRDGNGDPAGLPFTAIIRVTPGTTRWVS